MPERDDRPLVDLGSSYDDNGDAERRTRAKFEMTVWAVVTEPAYQVRIDPADKTVIVEFSERSFGDSDHGDDAVLQLTFGYPTTVLSLSNTLAKAGRELAAKIGDSTIEPEDT